MMFSLPALFELSAHTGQEYFEVVTFKAAIL